MLTESTPAVALLVLAALLAGFAATVRAVSSADHHPRPALLAGAAAAGVLATLVGLAPMLLGAGVVSPDLSTLTVLAAAGVVGGADVVELGLGARLAYLAWRARVAMAEGETARAQGRPADAAAAFGRAVEPLAAGRLRRKELDARLELADAFIAAGNLPTAAPRLHEALAVARELEDAELTWNALLRVAVMDCDLDRLPVARRHLAEAATIARERLSDLHLASVFAELAWIGYLGGDTELAGISLAWAGRAAGRIDPTGPFAATTTLLAGHLAMAAGELTGAEAAINAVPPASGDPDLEAGLQLARCCLNYLQGWQDSASAAVQQALPVFQKARWRSRLVVPLTGLSLAARRLERPNDARLIAATAATLAVRGGTMAALAARCADPAQDLSGDPRALELAGLFSATPDRAHSPSA